MLSGAPRCLLKHQPKLLRLYDSAFMIKSIAQLEHLLVVVYQQIG